MTYELWDLESRNLVESFATEDEALTAVCELVELDAAAYAASLALAGRRTNGEAVWLAQGQDLSRRASSAARPLRERHPT